MIAYLKRAWCGVVGHEWSYGWRVMRGGKRYEICWRCCVERWIG